MQDTKTRIKLLKQALPGMRERLAAVAVLLVFSIAMMTSVSFAWLTISAAPEVTGISTTVAANGNLEIALSDIDGLEPESSKVGDSAGTLLGYKLKDGTVGYSDNDDNYELDDDGNRIPVYRQTMDANLTWGNLVNLTDGYGLSELTLRPAQLNISGLVDGSPLWGATYDADGRITRLNKNFAFANWEPPVGNRSGRFVVSDVTQYGVRAISSYRYSTEAGDTAFQEVCDAVDLPLGQSMNAYSTLVRSSDNPYMDALAGLLGDYLTAQFGEGIDTLNVAGYVESLYQMMVAFEEAYRLAGDAMAKAANVRQFVVFGEGKYTDFTFETLMAASKEDLAAKGITFPAYGTDSNVTILDKYKEVYNQLLADIEEMSKYRGLSQVLWPSISKIVNNMVDIDSTEVDGYPVSNIGKNVALELIQKDEHVAIIQKGALYEYEKLTGRNMYVVDMAVKAKYIVTITLEADVYTKLHPNAAGKIIQSDFDRLMAYSKGGGPTIDADKVSEDTYGLALDFWLRTNADYPVLTLEGTVVKTETEEDVYVTIDDVEYQVYTATVNVSDGTEGGETQAVEIAAIQVEGQWYELTSSNKQGSEITPTDTIPKKNVIVELIGAEGENRVWQDNMAIEPNSTTQGGGSFYVYYADTPEDGLRSLELLKCIKIAFVDGNNNWLATASLNTGENEYFSANGKYYVPMVITEGGVTYTNDKGDTVKGITHLIKNTPTRITAILYLDGAELTNEMVLAASDIQGTLNIQFGTDGGLNSMSNEALETAVRDVSATVDKTSFNFDTDTDLTTNVTVSIAGDQPSRVTARFQRAITATQGTRLEEMEFVADADGNWHASYTFDSPGTYVLRSVTLDGVEVDLPEARTVSIAGFTVRTLEMDTSTVMTAASSVSRTVTLQFASEDASKMPTTVQGRLIHSGGNHSNVNFTYNTTTNTWTGTANLATSGTYTLEYLVLNGDYYPIDSSMQKTVEVSLGMRVRVFVVRPEQVPMVDANGNTVYEPLLDENGNPVTDENGNPMYQPLLDENGDPVTDENGNPMYQPVMTTIAGSLEFKFFGTEVPINVGVVVMDDQGTPLTDLDSVELQYLRDGSSLIENGLKAPEMKWNETTQRYEGTFGVKTAGVFDFRQVVVTSDGVTNYLTNATEAPTITSISPEPPTYQQGSAGVQGYEEDEHPAYIFAPNGDVTVTAKIAYSATGDYYAVFTRAEESNKIYVSPGVRGTEVDNVTNWTFEIPKIAGYQDGTWQLTEIWAGNGVYDKAGNQYTFDTADITQSTKHMVLDVPEDTDFAPVQVVQRINVSIVSVQDNLVISAGTFMESRTLPAGTFTVVFTDYQGGAIPDVSAVNMELQHNASTTSAYGHYTASLQGNTENFEYFALGTDPNSDNSRFASKELSGLKLAGEYSITKLSFKIGDRTYYYNTDGKADGGQKPDGILTNLVGEIDKVKVYSNAPTVKVTAVSPVAGSGPVRYYTTTNPSGANHLVEMTNKNSISSDGFSAVVYMYTMLKSGVYDQEPATFYQPQVTLQLENLTEVTSITANLGTTAVNFTTNNAINSAIVAIGGGTQGEEKWNGVDVWPVLVPAGEQSFDKLTVVYNNVTYTVELTNKVTINNPLAPVSLTYQINDATFDLNNLPDAEISPDGNSFTVTLEDVIWETEISETDGSATPTTASYGNPVNYCYVTSGKGSLFSPYKYTTFKCQKYRTTITGLIKYYNVQKEVTAWIIDGVTYYPGDRVTISGTKIATAVTSIDEDTKAFVREQETTEYSYYYQWEKLGTNQYASTTWCTEVSGDPSIGYNVPVECKEDTVLPNPS